MRRTWYYRLLLSYLPVFFAVTFILLFLYFVSLSDRNAKQVKEAHKTIGMEVMQLVDANLQEINVLFSREASNNKEMKAFFADATNHFNKYRAYEQIHGFMAINRAIESVYLINFKDKVVLSNSQPYTLEEFEQFSYLKQLRLENNSYKWSNVHTRDQVSSDNGQETDSPHVISLYKKIGNSEQNGLIVVNVGISMLREMINRTYGPNLAHIMVFTQDGTLVLDNSAEPLGEESAPIRFASSSSAELQSPVTGWSYQIGREHNWLFQSSSIVSNLGVLLAVLAVIAGALVIVLLTRKNYKPIEQYQNQILSEQELRNQYEIREMLEGNRKYHPAAWQHFRKQHGLPEGQYLRQCLLIEIDDGRNFNLAYSAKDQELLRFVLSNVVSEIAKEREAAIYSNWIKGERLLVLLYVAPNQANTLAGELAQSVIDWVRRNMRFTITIGIGTPVMDDERAAASYQEAKLTLSYKITLGKSRSLSYADLSIHAMRELEDPISRIAQIVRTVFQGKAEWEGMLHSLIETMKLQSLSRDDSLNLLQYLVYQLQKELPRQNESIVHYWTTELLPQLEERLHTDETLDELSSHLIQFIGPLCGMIAEQLRTAKHFELMHQVKVYIESNYNDDSLSLESLSSQFGISDKYLSRLFKETIGINFGEFITELRLEKAKELLRLTTEPIQTIGQRVGYTNPLTFTRVFKRTYGMTPSDMRQRLSRSAP